MAAAAPSAPPPSVVLRGEVVAKKKLGKELFFVHVAASATPPAAAPAPVQVVVDGCTFRDAGRLQLLRALLGPGDRVEVSGFYEAAAPATAAAAGAGHSPEQQARAGAGRSLHALAIAVVALPQTRRAIEKVVVVCPKGHPGVPLTIRPIVRPPGASHPHPSPQRRPARRFFHRSCHRVRHPLQGERSTALHCTLTAVHPPLMHARTIVRC